MSVLEGIKRDDPTYLPSLEEEYVRLKALEKGVKEEIKGAEGGKDVPPDLALVMRSLQDITGRLGRLELKPDSTDTASDVGVNAAKLIAGPLTKALSKLTGEEEEKGMWLRPETYAQADLKWKSRDCNKLDTISLFYGWISVADYLIHAGGDIASYINHVKYAVDMMNSRQFYDSGAIKYDRLIVDDYIKGKSRNFDPNPVASTLAFSSRVIPDYVEMCAGASITKGVHSYQAKQGRRRRNQNMQRPRL